MDRGWPTYIGEADSGGCHEVQWQLPKLTLTVRASDLGFAQRIIDFVAETRAQPEYRDIALGEGRYRHMEDKSIRLDDCFENVGFRFHKLGSSDQSYLLRFEVRETLTLMLQLHDDDIDRFLDGLKEAVDDHM